ncbi:hypothetical protein F4804DRAFT_302993 [Jackrogersella minutella]|nr:hypothetical protein F4804DRAFT_302993 [Jackrogersella minutella]
MSQFGFAMFEEWGMKEWLSLDDMTWAMLKLHDAEQHRTVDRQTLVRAAKNQRLDLEEAHKGVYNFATWSQDDNFFCALAVFSVLQKMIDASKEEYRPRAITDLPINIRHRIYKEVYGTDTLRSLIYNRVQCADCGCGGPVLHGALKKLDVSLAMTSRAMALDVFRFLFRTVRYDFPCADALLHQLRGSLYTSALISHIKVHWSGPGSIAAFTELRLGAPVRTLELLLSQATTDPRLHPDPTFHHFPGRAVVALPDTHGARKLLNLRGLRVVRLRCIGLGAPSEVERRAFEHILRGRVMRSVQTFPQALSYRNWQLSGESESGGSGEEEEKALSEEDQPLEADKSFLEDPSEDSD